MPRSDWCALFSLVIASQVLLQMDPQRTHQRRQVRSLNITLNCTLELQVKEWMCSCRKYLYSSHGRFLFCTPPPTRKFQLSFILCLCFILCFDFYDPPPHGNFWWPFMGWVGFFFCPELHNKWMTLEYMLLMQMAKVRAFFLQLHKLQTWVWWSFTYSYLVHGSKMFMAGLVIRL